MANSKNLVLNKKKPSSKIPPLSKKTPLAQSLQRFLVDFFNCQQLANPQLVVGFSGGLDSSVLLHLLHIASRKIAFKLHAHHVHHGLSPNADTWADFCQQQCRQLNVALTVTKINVDKFNGLGLEAAARKARYLSLQASSADFIVLGHHQDDQAETLLLQLARGAGVKGMAGMAVQDTKRKLLRPLLNVPRITLEAYAKQHKLTWIEDESNTDTQFDRNFMRHFVLPVLKKQYPVIAQTISRSAQHLAQASYLLDDLAQLDAKNCRFDFSEPSKLWLQPLANLSVSRINNCLRWWLSLNNLQMPSAAQLQQVVQQLFDAKADSAIKIKLAQKADAAEKLTLRRYQHFAYIVKDIAPYEPINLLWQNEETLVLPDNSSLFFNKKMGEGLSLRMVNNAELRIKNREGGERFLPELGRPSRDLKVMLQTHAMPPWQRNRLPLIFLDEKLVLIPNIAVDASLKASTNELGLCVDWVRE